ncbi:MAG: hypothetical protein C4321_07630 [Chloroflexota bacterium]
MVRRPSNKASQLTWRRARVVLMSGQGRTPAEIAQLLEATEDWVREVIHAFNQAGMDSLHPRWRPPAPSSSREPYASLEPPPPGPTSSSGGSCRGSSQGGGLPSSGPRAGNAPRTLSSTRRPRGSSGCTRTPGHVICFRESTAPSSPSRGPASPGPPGGCPSGQPPNYRKAPRGAVLLRGLRGGGRPALPAGSSPARASGPTAERFLKAVRARYPAGERIYLVMDNLFRPLDARGPGLGAGKRPGARAHPHLRLLAPAHRGRVRGQWSSGSWLAPTTGPTGRSGRAVHAYLRRRGAEARRHSGARQAAKRRPRRWRAHLLYPVLKAA